MKATVASVALLIVFCGLAIAQEPPAPPEGQTIYMSRPVEGHAVVRVGGPNGPSMRIVGTGRWWKDSELVKKIGVNEDQVQKIEKIFQDHRLDLIDLRAALEKQEAILEPLVEADQPDEAQVVGQIDKVAQARANLEKSDAKMLLAIRRVLTVDQWKKLRDLPGVVPFQRRPVGLPAVPPPGGGNLPESAPMP
jgi:Spy/CpxP family protein refolding chaperone